MREELDKLEEQVAEVDHLLNEGVIISPDDAKKLRVLGDQLILWSATAYKMGQVVDGDGKRVEASQ